MTRRITGYDHQLADMLNQSNGPYTHNLANLVLNQNIGDVELMRVFADNVIRLEAKYNKLNKELAECNLTMKD